MAPDSALAVTPLTAPAAVPAAYHDPAHAPPPPPNRARETTPTPSPASTDDLSPARIARLASYTRQLQSPPTASAVLESKRRRPDEEALEHSMNSPENKRRRLTEPNAADLTHQELAQLMAGATATPAMSRPQDSVTADGQLAVEAAAAAAARALGAGHIDTNTSPDMHDISPQSAVSAESGASLEEGDSQVVHSPGQMDADGRAYTQQPDAPMDGKTANSLSYPGLPGGPMQGPEGPQRGMSLPMTGSQNPELTPQSPPSGGRKHKCQHCPAEFTRHHNLKSHLLIHSQEKPYSCQQCTARFRRLHDLKRHSKLHTGEKPHMCPKCHRTFARGDALARHSKGIGGCAGKRASVENFTGEEDFDSSAMDGDDSAMAGVLYEVSADASMTEDERRRQSMPSIKAQHVAGQAGQDAFANHSNTYPPTGVRPPPGLFPPGIDRVSTSSTTSPTLPTNHTPQTSISSMPLSAGSSSMFSQTGMTESPKPLSPGSVQTNQAGQKRALTQQSAPGLSQPPHGMSPATKQAWLSEYPPANGTQREGNASAPSAAVRGRPRGSSGAGGRQGSNGVAADPSSLYSPNPTLMQFCQDLEDRIKKLTADLEAKNASEAQLRERIAQQGERIAQQDHSITTLQAEVADLRRQLSGPPQGDVAGPE